MDKEQFKAIAQDLKLAYQSDKFLADKDTFDLWYRHLEDKDEKYVRKSVNAYINHSHYPPHIADIRKGCQYYEDKDRKYLLEIWTEFDHLTSYYPQSSQEDAYGYFLEKLKATTPKEKWLDKAKEFYSNGMKYVNECDNKQKNVMKFREFIDEQIC